MVEQSKGKGEEVLSNEERAAETSGEAFLIADFEFMGDYTQETLRLGDKRVDVLLALSTAVYGGIVALCAGNSANVTAALWLALISSLGLSITGWFTFTHLLECNILVCEYARALNRIRAYFSDTYPRLKKYLLMPTSHEHPKYNWRGSGEVVIEVINSLSIGLFASIGSVFLRKARWIDVPIDLNAMKIGIPVFVIVAIAAGCLHVQYALKLFQSAESDAARIRANDKGLFASHERLSIVAAHRHALKAVRTQETESTTDS
jgi:hypothetical protein